MTIEILNEKAKSDYGYQGKPLEWQRGFDAAWKESIAAQKEILADLIQQEILKERVQLVKSMVLPIIETSLVLHGEDVSA